MLSKEAPARRLKLTFFAQAVHRFPVAGMAIIDELTVARQPFEKPTLELRAMGYRKLSARPSHHTRAAGAIENCKKACPRAPG